MKDTAYTIGFLAKAAQVNIETIRYYQRIGLIVEPTKPTQGYRKYPHEILTRIKFIKRAQQLGFSLQEINDLLELGQSNCEDVRHKAEQKLSQIDQQIKDLKRLRSTLNKLITSCNENDSSSNCAIVEALTTL